MANFLRRDRQIMVASLLTEGASIRSVERVTGVNRNTTMKLLVRIGEHCRDLHDQYMRDLTCEAMAADELWTYIGAKAKHCRPDHPETWGDSYTYLALDMHSKAVVSYLVGQRAVDDTQRFMDDLSSRIAGRTQLSVDGWAPYPNAIRASFNGRADAAAVVKQYKGAPEDEQRRYAPPPIVTTQRHWICGMPKSHLTTTSHVERLNWSVRTYLRRFTRLSNGFSRKWEHLRASVDLFVCWYNFCRPHCSLGMSPAMAQGVVSEMWKIDRLVPEWPRK